MLWVTFVVLIQVDHVKCDTSALPHPLIRCDAGGDDWGCRAGWRSLLDAAAKTRSKVQI